MRLDSKPAQWAISLGFIAVAALLFAHTPSGKRSIGDTVTFTLSLVPSDAVQLNCASDRSFGDVKCAFDRYGHPQDARASLHPYIALGGEIILASGVFESPKTAAWRSRATRKGETENRVPFECEGTLLGKVYGARVRWSQNASFLPVRKPPWAVRITRCTLKSSPPPAPLQP
jgi:hypothetical protein